MRLETTENTLLDLSRVMAHLERGEEVTVTGNGIPVAQLVAVPGSEARRREVLAAIADIRKFREGHSLGGIGIRELINEGRRF